MGDPDVFIRETVHIIDNLVPLPSRRSTGCTGGGLELHPGLRLRHVANPTGRDGAARDQLGHPPPVGGTGRLSKFEGRRKDQGMEPHRRPLHGRDRGAD